MRRQESVGRQVVTIKHGALGGWSRTQEKLKRTHEKRIGKAICDEIKRAEDESKKVRKNVRVFKIRDVIENKYGDKQVTATKHFRDGRRLETLEEICDNMLDFNVGQLEKEPITDDMVEVYKERAKYVDECLRNTNREDRMVTWDEYCVAVNKVVKNKKDVYRDFIGTGEVYKKVIFEIINKLLWIGEIPEECKITYLTKIYKGKGPRDELSSNRFVHGKDFFPKLIEKVIVTKVEKLVRKKTPEIQIGGQPSKGTRDHLLRCILTMREFKRKKEPLIFVLVDISKCFDKVRLLDLIYEGLKMGCNEAVLEYIYDFSNEMFIRLRGMGRDDMERKIVDTAGQGTDYACLMISYVMGKAVDDNVKVNNYEDSPRIDNIIIKPCLFVDDINSINDSYEKAVRSGEKLTKALDSLSLRANGDKTVIVVIGNKSYTRKVIKKFEEEPLKIQGKPIKVVECDKYLGFMVSAKGVEASIRETFDERQRKAWAKLFSIKRLLRHPVVQMNGFVGSGVTLFRAAIVPMLLYSADCWYGMSKNMIKKIEAVYRKMLYCFLDIPTHTKYETVLLELGLMKAENIIASQKICFINRVWNENQDEVNKKLLMRDYMKSEDGEGVLDEITRLCRERNILPITNFRQDNERIKEHIIRWNDLENWKESMKSKYSVTRMQTVNKFRFYHDFVRSEGRAVLLWRCGALRFRYQWKRYYMKKKQDISCPWWSCNENDTLKHAMECIFMNTKVDFSLPKDERMGKFVMQLNRERIKRFQKPIIAGF